MYKLLKNNWEITQKKVIMFSFLPNNVQFDIKNAILCLFLKNVTPSKKVVCFFLNDSRLPMVEGIGTTRSLVGNVLAY